MVEGANGPTTLPADRILQERKILVIPVSTFFMLAVGLESKCIVIYFHRIYLLMLVE